MPMGAIFALSGSASDSQGSTQESPERQIEEALTHRSSKGCADRLDLVDVDDDSMMISCRAG